MRAIFLGTGGYHPNDRRETAGIFLPEIGVLFDAGTGTYRLAEHLQTPELTIFLTHAHLDHVVGLTYLIPHLYLEKIKKLRLFGTAETLETVQNQLFSERLFPVKLPCEFIPLSADGTGPGIEVSPGVHVVSRRQPRHPGGSVGYRLDVSETGQNGKDANSSRRLAYVTDTSDDPETVPFVRGVHVLVHECYFPDAMQEWAVKTGHSHTTPVAQLAKEAGVGRLLLTHIDPLHPDPKEVELPVARRIFPQTDLAEDQMSFDI
ncbi:MAG: MBL fold metallo-hydrolase [Planctomycetaceae bacterium]